MSNLLHGLHHWIQDFAFWGVHLIQEWGYAGVVFLMSLESSIFPLPSEVVIPPAAFSLNPWGVILAGTVGSWIGSAVTYAISRWVGRPVIVRWGKYFFISESKLERAEVFMTRYEAGGIFFARLLPVVRHLISIPAGVVRMPFGKFSLMTILGSALWCSILTWYGKSVITRHPELRDAPDKLGEAVKSELPWIAIAAAGLCLLYFVMLKLTAPKKAAAV